MWYRTAIDLGSLFGRKKPEPQPPAPTQKPPVPKDVFSEYVKAEIPRTNNEIINGLGDHHLILTGTGDIHQGPSHSIYVGRILDEARKKLSANPELREQYNIHKLPENAYGPEDLVQIRNERRNPEDPIFYQEDAVTEIIHDYFDQGIRISNMAGLMSVNAAHVPSLMQIQKIYEIINLLNPKPKEVQVKIITDKGQFLEVYKVDDIGDLKRDILEFKIHGQRQQSTMREWRRL